MTLASIIRRTWNRFWLFTFVSMTILLVLLLVLAYGPPIEGALFPISSVEALSIVRDGNRVSYYVHAVKYRDCALTALANWVTDEKTGARMNVAVSNEVGGPAGTLLRPVGEYTYGPFSFTLPKGFENATYLSSAGWFSCHPVWLQQQSYRLLTIPPKPPQVDG